MPQHEAKPAPAKPAPAPPVLDASRGSAVDPNDTPGRTTGEQIVADVKHDVEAFVAEVEAAFKRGVPHGVLRRLVELHEWANQEHV